MTITKSDYVKTNQSIRTVRTNPDKEFKILNEKPYEIELYKELENKEPSYWEKLWWIVKNAPKLISLVYYLFMFYIKFKEWLKCLKIGKQR